MTGGHRMPPPQLRRGQSAETVTPWGEGSTRGLARPEEFRIIQEKGEGFYVETWVNSRTIRGIFR